MLSIRYRFARAMPRENCHKEKTKKRKRDKDQTLCMRFWICAKKVRRSQEWETKLLNTVRIDKHYSNALSNTHQRRKTNAFTTFR